MSPESFHCPIMPLLDYIVQNAVQRDSLPGCPTRSVSLSLWLSERVHRQRKALDEPTSGWSVSSVTRPAGGDSSAVPSPPPISGPAPCESPVAARRAYPWA